MRIQYACIYAEITNGLFDRMFEFVPHFARMGGNDILFPPSWDTQYGGNSSTMGYDPIRDLSVGQFMGRALRWGTAMQGQRAVARCHRFGVIAGVDWPVHQYGGKAPLYELGPDGKVDVTLFPKTAACFVPGAKVDKVFDADGNKADGLMVSYQGSLPKGYMLKGKIAAFLWYMRRTGWDYWREDEAKGESIETTKALKAAIPGDHIAEVYTGDPAELDRFVQATGMVVLDFTAHFAYRAVSQGASLRTLVGNGYYTWNNSKDMIYIESHDTVGPDGIVNFKLWMYLHGLTMPAHGCQIFGMDYEVFGLGLHIDQMMWVSQTFAIGKLAYEYESDSFLVWSRDGDGGDYWSGGLLCGINSDPIDARSEWVHTSFGPNAHLHDYLGHGPDIWTNADGWAYLTIGPNVYSSAQNGVAYAAAGVNRTIPTNAIANRQSGSYFDFADF